MTRRTLLLLAALLCVALLVMPAIHANIRPGTGQIAPTYDSNPFLRAPNYTLNISKVPPDLVNPAKITNPILVQQDVLIPGPSPVRLDPRTCAGEYAICYQILANDKTVTPESRGVNKTNLGSYAFPYRRLRFFGCLGDDKRCIAQARGCFCPGADPLPRVEFLGDNARCDGIVHQCEIAPGFVALCKGNFTSCVEQYGNCGCGKFASCNAVDLQTCLTDRNELYACSATLPDCLNKYETCACGNTALVEYKPSCPAHRHRCVLGFTNVTCEGDFAACAIQYDRCWCGTS